MAFGALPCYWAHLVGVLGGVKLHSKSIIIMIIYPALTLVIGGRDGMDCSRCVWMTYSIYRIHHQSRRLRMVFIVGNVGHLFS